MTTRTPDPRREITPLARPARITAVAALAGIGALHALWGNGSDWPMANRADLSAAVLGSPGLAGRDGARACFAMAGTLGAAAAMVAGGPERLERPRRLAVAGIVAVLATRGALGLAGRTDLMVPVATGARFRRLDRRAYAPLCLILSVLVALTLTEDRR